MDKVKNYSYIYLALIDPDTDPTLMKVGYTVDLSQRADAHRTIAPSIEFINSWECISKASEGKVLKSLKSSSQIKFKINKKTLKDSEVFNCPDITNVVEIIKTTLNKEKNEQ